MEKQVLLSGFVFFVLLQFCRCTIPSYIQVCHHDNPDLAGCILKSIEALRPLLKTGIPELQVPSLEPLTLRPFVVNTTTPQSQIIANLSDFKAYGASDFKILKLRPTLTKNGYTFRYEVIVPKIHVTGNYEIDSKILFVNIQGRGPFNATIDDYHFECIMKGHKIQKSGTNYLEFDKMKCNLVIGKATIYFDNLFNGNALLGRATNDALNDNSAILFDEIKPLLINAVSERFTEVANKITLSFSYEELFP